MKELVVISGKGGTGKTCLTAAFSSLADKMILCDADVDAADMPIFSADYGRNPFNNPCPTESRVPWCNY